MSLLGPYQVSVNSKGAAGGREPLGGVRLMGTIEFDPHPSRFEHLTERAGEILEVEDGNSEGWTQWVLFLAVRNYTLQHVLFFPAAGAIMVESLHFGNIKKTCRLLGPVVRYWLRSVRYPDKKTPKTGRKRKGVGGDFVLNEKNI